MTSEMTRQEAPWGDLDEPAGVGVRGRVACAVGAIVLALGWVSTLALRTPWTAFRPGFPEDGVRRVDVQSDRLAVRLAVPALMVAVVLIFRRWQDWRAWVCAAGATLVGWGAGIGFGVTVVAGTNRDWLVRHVVDRSLGLGVVGGVLIAGALLWPPRSAEGRRHLPVLMSLVLAGAAMAALAATIHGGSFSGRL